MIVARKRGLLLLLAPGGVVAVFGVEALAVANPTPGIKASAVAVGFYVVLGLRMAVGAVFHFGTLIGVSAWRNGFLVGASRSAAVYCRSVR